MPITKSAKKALRQSKKRRAKNIRALKSIRKLLKETDVLVLEKKTDKLKEVLPKVYKALDKAAKTGLIKKNTVARKKSRITKAMLR